MQPAFADATRDAAALWMLHRRAVARLHYSRHLEDDHLVPRGIHAAGRLCVGQLQTEWGEPVYSRWHDAAGVRPVLVQMWEGVDPVPAQMWAGVSPVQAQVLQGRVQSRCRCGRRLRPVPVQMWAEASPVLVQMWACAWQRRSLRGR